MRRKIQYLIILVLACMAARAQEAQVWFLAGTPTVAICPGTPTTLMADTWQKDNLTPTKYTWDFDNGDVMITTAPEVTYSYPTGGSYMARVTAQFDGGEQATSLLRVDVGMRPSFSRYTSDVPASQSGICLGESAQLSMQLADTAVTYRCLSSYMEKAPQSIFASYWTAKINYKCFHDLMVTEHNMPDSISVILQTASAADILIELSTPGGSSITLKPYDAEPATVRPYSGDMVAYIFHPGDYGAMAQSPYNGDWQITVHSRGTSNEASALGWKMHLKESLTAQYSWSYTQQYNLRRAVWSGKGIGATSMGSATATPQAEGSSRYQFVVADDFGCLHDTAVYIDVERAVISGPGDSAIYIGDEIQFRNPCSWASVTSWSFGDGNQGNGASQPHAYYEKGRYMAIMTATSASGCSDSDTMMVSIIPRPLEIKEVNIFTPNGDGQNDIFTFFRKEESFLESGGLTKMPANIVSIKGKIYNTYGQTVYKWDNVPASIFGWDGTWNNNGSRPCPPGTYYYDIIVHGKDGQTLKRTGSIFLYRSK